MRLTDRAIEALRCPEGKKDALFFDEALPGFGLRVQARGARTFVFQYRVGSKVRRAVLGAWGAELTATQARRKAELLKGQVRDARDPVAERRAARAQASLAEAVAREERERETFTVGVLIQQWAEQHLVQRSLSYRFRVPDQLRRVLDEYLNTPAVSFAHADAIAVLDAVKATSGPIAANRARAVARSCWGWAHKRGQVPGNPWQATPRPSLENSRERVLSDAELRDVWLGASRMGHPWCGIIQLLVLTGQRRSEVAGLGWDELDLSARRWNLPARRSKNGRSNVVPLTEPVLAILRGIERKDRTMLVFEGARKTVPSGFGRAKRRLDRIMAEVAHTEGRKFEAWTLHDIRRSVATGLQRLGVRLEVTEAVLNHVSGSRSGIVGVYQRHGWDAEKAEALDKWTAHVMALASGLR